MVIHVQRGSHHKGDDLKLIFFILDLSLTELIGDRGRQRRPRYQEWA